MGRHRLLILLAGSLVAAHVGTAQAYFGDLDPTWGGDGIVTTDSGDGSADQVKDIAVLPTGPVYAAGRMFTGGGADDFALARYQPDGTLDTDFGGGDGIATANIGGSESDDSAERLAVQDDGKIVLAGYTQENTPTARVDVAVARFTDEGVLDTDFGGGDGIVVPDLSATFDAYADDVVIDGSDRIVVSGAVQTTPDDTYETDFAFVRLNENGTLDSSFDGDSNNGNGIVAVSFNSGNESYEEAYAVGLLGDGDIVATGDVWPGNSTQDQIGLVRLDAADGKLDTSFDADGRVVTSMAPANIYAVDLVVDGGTVAVAARSNAQAVIARYIAADGSLDEGFGNQGITLTPAPSPYTFLGAESIAIDGNHYLLGGNASGTVNETFKGAMFAARYHSGGGLDTLFGGDGVAIADTVKDDPADDPNPSFEGANSVAVIDDGNALTDNKVMLGGDSNPGDAADSDFTLARLGPDITPPVTKITAPKKKTTDRTPALKFKVDDPEATSRCRMDNGDWVDPCSSPQGFGRLSLGSHVVSVESTDLDGNVETPSAKRRFKIIRK